MEIRGDRLWFGRRRRNPWRLAILLALIGAGIWLVRMVEAGQVQPLFLPTPTPTRTVFSYREEAETFFAAGNLKRAIEAYQQAAALNPDDARLLADMARVQTYASALETTGDARRARLAEARQTIDRAVELAPDDSYVQAIRALVYDWSASAEDEREGQARKADFLKIAEEAARRAFDLDNSNSLALAFLAEVLVDQGKYALAYDFAEQAVLQDPNSMDAHRVFATVLESNGAYRAAIEEYLKAVELNPNLTFLHLRIGANYRRLRDIDRALEYFATAAKINEQNGVADPIPYLAIGRTYLQEGQFFIAARNVERAVAIDPGNAELWGFLGIVYFKARNYESALPVLQCAVEGCSAEESGQLLCDLKILLCDEDQPPSAYGVAVPGLRLEQGTLEYYYTYGSALAFMDQNGELCRQAEPIFQQLISLYGEDPIVAGIVAENRAICEGTIPGPVPAETPAPGGPTG